MSKNTQSFLIDLGILMLIIGVAYFATLGMIPLFTPDEGRYAEISREMLATHQYIIPHLDGVIYFEKPPLIYWLVAFFEHTFGYSEWSARAANTLMGILTCLSLYVFSRHYYNRCTGYFAALSLASSLLFFGMARMITLDTGLTFFITLSLLSLFSGLHEKNSYLLWLGYACIALGILTKGLVGIIFPGMILFLWLAITQQWLLLKHARIISGCALILIIALPWHLLAQAEVPSFFHEYIIVQQFLRFLTPIMHRQMSFGAYLALFILGFFPWIIFTGLYLKKLLPQLKNRMALQKEWFFLSWIIAIFLFFAPSKSILIPYLEPMMPAMALLTAPYLAQLWQSGSKKLQRTLIIIMLSTTLLFNAAWLIYPHIAQRSTKTLSLQAAALMHTHPDAQLVNYNYYHQDFPYYAQHLVLIVNWMDELAPGYAIQPDAKNILISDADFWKLMASDKPIYVITDKASYANIQTLHPQEVFLISETTKDVLITNAKGKPL